MSTKADLLKQIDDAASQYGGAAPSQTKSRVGVDRGQVKRTGEQILKGNSGLTGNDLASLNNGNQ